MLEVICTFFAILEMVKYKEIVIYQNKLFGDIRIGRGETTKPETIETHEAGEAAVINEMIE